MEVAILRVEKVGELMVLLVVVATTSLTSWLMSSST